MVAQTEEKNPPMGVRWYIAITHFVCTHIAQGSSLAMDKMGEGIWEMRARETCKEKQYQGEGIDGWKSMAVWALFVVVLGCWLLLFNRKVLVRINTARDTSKTERKKERKAIEQTHTHTKKLFCPSGIVESSAGWCDAKQWAVLFFFFFLFSLDFFPIRRFRETRTYTQRESVWVWESHGAKCKWDHGCVRVQTRSPWTKVW